MALSIEQLKNAVSIVQVLDYYNWVDDLGWQSGWSEWQKTLCPFHDDHNPSASVNIDEDRFHCFTCGISGDVIDLVAWEEELDTKEAMQFIIEEILCLED